MLENETFFSYGKLTKFARENYQAYVSADSFPHIMIEDFIQADTIPLQIVLLRA